MITPDRLGGQPTQAECAIGRVIAITDGVNWYRALILDTDFSRTGGRLPSLLVDVAGHGRKRWPIKGCRILKPLSE